MKKREKKITTKKRRGEEGGKKEFIYRVEEKASDNVCRGLPSNE